MRTKIMNGLILLGMIGFIGLTSCKKDDESGNTEIKSQVETNIQQGSWVITKFVDSDKSELYHFETFEFMFNDNGILSATDGTDSYNGNWSITSSDSNDDSSDDLDFNIHFNLTNEFEDLNDDWDILSQSEDKIELRDVSGGDGSIDYLTFEKKQ